MVPLEIGEPLFFEFQNFVIKSNEVVSRQIYLSQHAGQ